MPSMVLPWHGLYVRTQVLDFANSNVQRKNNCMCTKEPPISNSKLFVFNFSFGSSVKIAENIRPYNNLLLRYKLRIITVLYKTWPGRYDNWFVSG